MVGTLARMESPDRRLVYVSSTPDGSHAVLHDPACAIAWAHENRDRPTPEARRTVSRLYACIHCAWCSQLVQRPPWCVEHDTTCPDTRGVATDAYRRVAAALVHDFPYGVIPDPVWDTIAELWEPTAGHAPTIIEKVRAIYMK